MIVVSFLLVMAVLFLISVGCVTHKDQYVKEGLNPESIMNNDIGSIETSNIKKYGGSVDVVTNTLDVIHLEGENRILKNSFNMTEWTAFLEAAHAVEQNVNYNISYNEIMHFWLVVTFPRTVSAKLYFVVDINDTNDLLEAVRIVFGILFIYLFLIAVSAAFYSKIAAKNFIQPIRKLCYLTKNLENGKFREGIDAIPITELEEVQRGLVHLGRELSIQEQLRLEAEANKKTLIRDISHDLKNPLTSIRGFSELCLQKEDLTEDKKQAYLQIIHNHAIRANGLIDGLFEYSKLDSIDFKITYVKTELCELLRKKLAAFVVQLEANKMQYDAQIPEEEIYCLVDNSLINRALDNLFENVCNYNKENTKLTVILKPDKENIFITVMDNGIGMSEEFAKHCFEPFSRVDTARNSKTGGSGLGLSIVKKIIDLHNGDIQLTSEANRGSTFVIRLKREF